MRIKPLAGVAACATLLSLAAATAAADRGTTLPRQLRTAAAQLRSVLPGSHARSEGDDPARSARNAVCEAKLRLVVRPLLPLFGGGGDFAVELAYGRAAPVCRAGDGSTSSTLAFTVSFPIDFALVVTVTARVTLRGHDGGSAAERANW